MHLTLPRQQLTAWGPHTSLPLTSELCHAVCAEHISTSLDPVGQSGRHSLYLYPVGCRGAARARVLKPESPRKFNLKHGKQTNNETFSRIQPGAHI